MQFEHFAINVPDAAAMAQWYVEHCRMRAVRALTEEPYTHFLADEGGRVVMEIYSNPSAPTMDFGAQDPLVFHFAFAVRDPVPLSQKLIAAGASLADDVTLDDGSHLIMLRDPWGVPLQLCERTTPMVEA